MKKQITLFPVSVIVPVHNSETTVLKTLKSILEQDYPIKEIVIIDNLSTDNSVSLIRNYIKLHKRIPMKIIEHKENVGVGTSYNEGVALSRSKYIIFMHSDSILIDKKQFTLLTAPFRQNAKVIATCALATVPRNIWLKYPFWEKCLLVQSVDKYSAGLNGKCDCHKKDTFLNVNGFDEQNYARDENIGGEDGDLALRLKPFGRIVASKAKVIHLHSLDKRYSFSNFKQNRKLLARSYGRFLRFHPDDFRIGTLGLLAKPTVSLFSILGPYPWNMLMLFLFANVFYLKLFITPEVWKHREIFLLPFVTVFFVFYEAFWNIQGFLYLKKKNV